MDICVLNQPSFEAGLSASDSSVHSSAVFDSRLMIQKPPMNYCCAPVVNLMTELPATGIQTAICVTFIIIFFYMRRSQTEDLLWAYESSGQKEKASVGSCALTQMRCGVTQEKIALQGKRWRERLRTTRFLRLQNNDKCPWHVKGSGVNRVPLSRSFKRNRVDLRCNDHVNYTVNHLIRD